MNIDRTKLPSLNLPILVAALVLGIACDGARAGTRPLPKASKQAGSKRPPQITLAPLWESSLESVLIIRVELVKARAEHLVRILLRNSTDESVVGYHFSIEGPDPLSGGGFFTVGCLRETPSQVVIEPHADLVVDVSAENFEPGSVLRLDAVLFESGRGEGEQELIKEMHSIAKSDCNHVPRPAQPLP